MKDLNIVLLNYHTKDDILRSVESVIHDIHDSPCAIHLTVADNSENADGIRESLAQRFPSVLYLDCGGNVGFGRGNTMGMQAVPSRYYFILNRDTIVPRNSHTMDRTIAYLDAHPRVGAIGPKLLNMDGTLQYSCYRFDLTSIAIKPFRQLQWDRRYRWIGKKTDRLLMKDFDHASTRPVDWVQGAAIVVRHDAIMEVGWFDPDYFLYMEDCDWCRSLWHAGWPVYYVHDIEILHEHARESARIPGLRALLKNRLARTHLKSWFRYVWKWRKEHKYVGGR